MSGSPIRYFVIDAFTNRPFKGNPAAVVPLDHWRDDSTSGVFGLRSTRLPELHHSESGIWRAHLSRKGIQLQELVQAADIFVMGGGRIPVHCPGSR